MQKAIIVQASGKGSMGTADYALSAKELNSWLEKGWKVTHLAPFGTAASEGGQSHAGVTFSAVLVIIENESESPVLGRRKK